MPTVSLRLTDAEHDELKAWAHDGHRSLQKEIIFRLFSSGAAVGEAAVSGSAESIREEEEGLSRSNPVRPERAAPEDHFKPDFKKPKK